VIICKLKSDGWIKILRDYVSILQNAEGMLVIESGNKCLKQVLTAVLRNAELFNGVTTVCRLYGSKFFRKRAQP
jgi:hypothetical protein